MDKHKRANSQVVIELVVGFIVIVLFFLGASRIWVWSNAQVVGRSPAYKESRISAGNTHPGFWGNTGEEGVYTPKELTDGWVFGEDASSGSSAVVNIPNSGNPTKLNFVAAKALQNEINDDKNKWKDWVDVDPTDPAAIQNAINEVTEAITEMEADITIIEDWRDKWQNWYDLAVAGISQANNDIIYWQGRVSYHCPCTPSEWDDCSNCEEATARLAVAKDGGRHVWDPDEGEWGEYVYDPSQAWMSTWATRSEFADDYYLCQIAGSYYASKNRYVQEAWIPGLSDWQEREIIAQVKRDEWQDSLDEANDGLDELKKIKADLEAMLAAL